MVKIDHLVDVSLIQHDMDKFRARFTEAEGRISQLEDTTRSDSRDLRALQLQVKALQEKSIDTENRLRSKNMTCFSMAPRSCCFLITPQR